MSLSLTRVPMSPKPWLTPATMGPPPPDSASFSVNCVSARVLAVRAIVMPGLFFSNSALIALKALS